MWFKLAGTAKNTGAIGRDQPVANIKLMILAIFKHSAADLLPSKAALINGFLPAVIPRCKCH
jgi:hypothetical protein